ncbi:MAG: TPM domain-containing protein [Saprospiraceae bacterium]
MNKLLLVLFGVCISWAVWAKQVPEPTQYLVNDYAGLLSRQEVEALGQKLRDYVAETSTQIVIVTENSLEGDDAFDYTQRLASAWGIGGQENDNGILIYIAKDDRQIRIQTGYGTEAVLAPMTPNALSTTSCLLHFGKAATIRGCTALRMPSWIGQGRIRAGDGLPTKVTGSRLDDSGILIFSYY